MYQYSGRLLSRCVLPGIWMTDILSAIWLSDKLSAIQMVLTKVRGFNHSNTKLVCYSDPHCRLNYFPISHQNGWQRQPLVVLETGLNLSCFCSHLHVIDVGAGLGYVDQILSHTWNYSVYGIESHSGHHNNALQRAAAGLGTYHCLYNNCHCLFAHAWVVSTIVFAFQFSRFPTVEQVPTI